METDIELSSLFASAEPAANEESLKTALLKRLGESHAEEIKATFAREVGALTCHDIKTQTGTPCPVCVETAAKLVERFA